jgi:hypothetical protein
MMFGMSGTHGYWEPPAVGDEASTLLGSLERQRATFAWKCADLDKAALSVHVGSSTLTLAKLLKHLALMEDLNFTGELAGLELPAPWAEVEPARRSNWAFESASDDEPEDLYRLWAAAVDRSRKACDDFLRDQGADATFESEGGQVAFRRLMVDLIEEYGRHTGHADLIRESIDGRVGEDPPGPAKPFTRL